MMQLTDFFLVWSFNTIIFTTAIIVILIAIQKILDIQIKIEELWFLRNRNEGLELSMDQGDKKPDE